MALPLRTSINPRFLVTLYSHASFPRRACRFTSRMGCGRVFGHRARQGQHQRLYFRWTSMSAFAWDVINISDVMLRRKTALTSSQVTHEVTQGLRIFICRRHYKSILLCGNSGSSERECIGGSSDQSIGSALTRL